MRPSIFILILAGVFLSGCSASDSTSSNEILRDQLGTLSWGGAPEVDGLGITFASADTTYGIPGVLSDFSDYFPDELNQVWIWADVHLTGKTTVRGWGASFPEATLSHIDVVVTR